MLSSIQWEEIDFFRNIHIDFDELSDNFILRKTYAGETIIKDQSINTKFYLIRSGTFTVNKGELVLITLGPNKVFGEISSMLSLQTNADVICKTDGEVYVLDSEKLKGNERSENLLHDLTTMVAKEVAFKLNTSNQGYAQKLKKENEDLKEKRRYSILFTQIFTCISLYAFCLDLIRRFEHRLPSNTIISGIIILVFAILLLYLLVKSNLPLESYGITFKNWKSNLLIAFLYSIPFLVIIFSIKFIWVYFDTSGSVQLFQPEAIFTKPEDFNLKFYIGAIIAYCALSITQEFIGRCGIHATLRNFYLSDENPSEWKGIIVSSILFMATHAHLGALFSALVFLPGVFWAWLFTKQNSIVGPAFSHCIIGVFAIFILGFPLS